VVRNRREPERRSRALRRSLQCTRSRHGWVSPCFFLVPSLKGLQKREGKCGLTNDLTRREAFARQRHDWIATFCNVSHDDAILTDEKRHRRRENSVLSRQFPTFLKDEWKSDSVLCRLLFVLLGIAASDHDDCKPIVAVLAMPPYQLRC